MLFDSGVACHQRSSSKSQWNYQMQIAVVHVERCRPEILLILKEISRQRFQVNPYRNKIGRVLLRFRRWIRSVPILG